MRILYVTTIGGTMNFFVPFIRKLLDEGHIVDIAANEEGSKVRNCYREWGCRVYPISTTRSPLNRGNLTAIGQLKRIVEQNQYDIVHCHTPIAAACTRLACRSVRKKGTKVFYTAHGFHFYKGAPFKNWLIYYTIERFCSYFTDVLFTMNQEDYALAQKKMKASCVEYVPGVGLDLTKFSQVSVDRVAKRKELGIPENAIVLFSVGELNKNKNHETVIRSIADLDVYYLIAGSGSLQPHLQNVIDELKMKDRVKLLGFRNDILELLKSVDIFVFPSFREGLPVSVMEAMASGLPCVASDIRGVRDLIIDGKNGFLCEPSDKNVITNAISILAESEQLRVKFGLYSKEKVSAYGYDLVERKMMQIYKKLESKNHASV